MIIYVDLVFLLNIFLDFLLLMVVNIVLVRNVPIKRIIYGSLIGGVSILILFIKLNSLILFLFKIILGILMIIVTFGYKNIKYTYNNLFYFFTISFSVGGVLYLLKSRGLYNDFILIIGFMITCYIYVRQMKRLKNNYQHYYQVDIYYKNKKMSLIGYLDTGNKLYDNYKHRPIILIDQKIDYDLSEIIYVSYASLNHESILKCLKADKIIINNHTFKNYLIGLSERKFYIDGVNCLLHSKMKGDLHA